MNKRAVILRPACSHTDKPTGTNKGSPLQPNKKQNQVQHDLNDKSNPRKVILSDFCVALAEKKLYRRTTFGFWQTAANEPNKHSCL